MSTPRTTGGDLVPVGALLPGALDRIATDEGDGRRVARLEGRVGLLRELLDATAAELDEERRLRENLDSDHRRLIERVEALEAAEARR